MEIIFKAKISKMGDVRLIWIPKKFHKKINKSDKQYVRVLIKQDHNIRTIISTISKKGDDRIVRIPLFEYKNIKIFGSNESFVTIKNIN